MAVELEINGQIYEYPEPGDTDWGGEATGWAEAVTVGMLQKAGGLFQLLAELDFGTNFGVKSLYYKTRATNVATAGQFRLGNEEVISWRNFENDANLDLKVNASNVLEFDGTGISVGGDPVQTEITVSDTATINLTLAASNLSADIVTASITNAMINAAAAIAYSKLSLTGSIVNADLANMTASTIKGRISTTGAPQDLTATQVTAILDAFVGDSGSGGTKGLVPAPVSGDGAAGKFLCADGTWTAPTGSGDVVGPASSANGQLARFGDTSGKLLTATPATISNSDVASNAAIAVSKLAALTASRALVSDGSGVVTPATTTATEIGYVNGVTSAIQTQIDAKMTNPMTTGGDVIYGGASGAPTRLANGTSGQVLTSSGGTSAPTWTTVSGTTAATQSDQETGTSTTVFVSPGRQQYHASAAKARVQFNGTGTVSVGSSYNVTSITDNGAGLYTVNLTVPFSSGSYSIAVTIGTESNSGRFVLIGSSSSSSAFQIRVSNLADSANVDASYVSAIMFGDQ